MDLKELRERLDILSQSLNADNERMLKARINSLASAFPFSEYEYILMFLLDKKAITFEQYESLRDRYVSANKYLELFNLAPRVFGEIWGQRHIIDLDRRFLKPNKGLDPEYNGEYDLWIQGIKVEVKAGRAINTRVRGSLVSKALRYGTREPFWMNYQQIKLNLSDVFILIGVWVDRLVYWVMSNQEVKENRHLSHQHRGGIEYQIGITDKNIGEFEEYRVSAENLANTVLLKGRKR